MREAAAGRAGAEPEEIRVTTLELFFDLVFVFTLTQLTALVEHELSLLTVLRVVLLFVILYWMYSAYVWLTNQVPPDRLVRRLLIFAAMAAFLVCALAIPHAFDGTGVEFGIGYLLVVLIHGGLYAQSFTIAALRFVPLNAVGALAIIGAALTDGPLSAALWIAPIPLQYLTSWLSQVAMPVEMSGLRIRPAHFVERHGLLLIVAFGESVVAVGIGIGDIALDTGVLTSVLLGLALASALWWVYFGNEDESATTVLRRAPPTHRGRLALNAYFYAFIPMLLGIVIVAAGVVASVGHLGAPLAWEAAALLSGGVALYLGGEVLFRLVLGLRPIAYRLVAAMAAVALLPLGTALSAGVLLAALVAVVVGTLALEARVRRRPEPPA
jgi:low temperature requirement protein LtrA